MNTGKRLLSVLMCIAMLVSMMTTFVFANTDGSEVEVIPEVNVNTLTGAKPTTDVAAPTVSKDVFVVDSTVTAETTGYVLTWEGNEYSTYDVDGVATDMFVYGVNLFATIAEAQAVAPVGATYLVKSVAYSVAFGDSSAKQGITKAGSFYTEAYNTMPFVVGEAFDGSDWSLNSDYVAKSVTLNGFDVRITDAANAVGGVNLYGFTVSYGSYAYDINNTTVSVDVNIVNSYYLPTSADATLWISASTYSRLEVQNSNLTVKNMYVGGSTHRFASEYLPDTTVFDGWYFPANVDIGGIPYLKQGLWGHMSSITIRNWNVQSEELSIYFQGNNNLNYALMYKTATDTTSGETAIAGAQNNKNWRTVTVENCTINNGGLYSVAKPAITHGNALSHFYFTGNRLINTTGTTAEGIGAANKWNESLGITLTNNYYQGYVAADNFGSANVGTFSNSTGITIKDNYLSDGVSEVGTQMRIGSTIDNKDWYATDWYVDAAMTVKATEVLTSIRTDAVAFSRTGLAVTLYVNEGDTASISSDDVVLAADADLTALTAGVYTVNVTRTIEDVAYTIPYTVTVVGFTNPLIQQVEDETGLIDGDKVLFVDASADGAETGSLLEVVWKGKTYSAVVGTTAFATLSAAQTYAKNNAIDTPNFLIKSEIYNGSTIAGEVEWNTMYVNTPGKYFTQNYDKKPYTASDRALDPTGSEWASNVNTGEADSFNTADGIEVKWMCISNSEGNAAPGGKYELYGFTITNCIQDAGSRSESIDVLFQNLYIEKNYADGFFTTASSQFNSYAVANTRSDKMYLKDVYFANPSSVSKGLFQSGDTFLWAYTTIDGLFADFNGITDGANHWINTYNDKHSFTIKNSNIRNAQEKIMIQGDNNKGVNLGNVASNDYKWFELDNNIFYNFTFCGGYTSAFVYVKQAFHNRIWITNNFIYTGRDAAVALQSGYGGDSRQPDTWYKVNNNTLLGIKDSITVSRWISAGSGRVSTVDGNYITADIIAEEDLLAGNVTAQGTKFVLYNNNHTGGVKNFTLTDNNAWLNYERTIKVSALTDNISAYVENGGFYVLTKLGTPKAQIYLPSGITAADVLVCDTSPVWYDTDGNEVDATEITKESVNITDENGEVIGADYVIELQAYVGDDENQFEATIKMNVNVVPNTIEAYPQSVYEFVETEVDNGDGTTTTTKSITHPTEKEVLEDVPHISGGFYDEMGMINSVDAAIIDGLANYSSYKYTITAGEYKQFEWMGQNYVGKFGETLYQNVDTAYSSESAIGTSMPQYLLKAGEWSWLPSQGFYGGTGSDYIVRSPGKFFTENYATDPYFAGDNEGNGWESNIGTEEGQFNPDKYLKAAYLTINNDAKAGRYELYGFTVGVGVRDIRTTNVNAVDLYMKNTYFSCDGANSYIFSGNESNNIALQNGSPDSKLYVETAYVASKGSRSFLRNSAWSDIIFDGMYADFAENTKTGTSYFHQTYDEFQLVIKNSFFTNTFADITYFEGTNGGTNHFGYLSATNPYTFKEGRKALVLENNVFKDYSFNGTTSFINVKGGGFSEIVLRDNYINNEGKAMSIFTNIDANQNLAVDPEFKLVVENNTFIGFNGKTNTSAARPFTADSNLEGNIAYDASGNIIPIVAHDSVNNDYYMDSAKEILGSDIKIDAWTTSGVEYAIDDSSVVITKAGGTPSISGIVTNGNVAVYADKACTEAIDDIAAEGTSYVKIYLVNSEGYEASKVYAATVLGTSDNLFKDKYVVPSTDDIKTSIDRDKAMIIDYSVNEAEFGSIVTVAWQGVEYDFIKGVTAFATISEFNTYMAKANIENPSVLMNSITDGNLGSSYAADIAQFGVKGAGEFQVRYPGRYYTANYNIKPFTVDGDVWAENPEFAIENAIVARWIKVHNNVSAGDVELYGFVVGAQFQNNGEQTTGTTEGAPNLYIENGYAASFEGYDAPRAPFLADSRYVRINGAEAGGSLTAKNVYVSSALGRTRTLLAQSNYTSDFTLDGIFVDNSQAEFYDRTTEEDLDEAKCILEGDSTITIKNSKASGFAYSVRFVILTEEHDDTDNNHAIVFDNNVFENVTFGGSSAFIQVDGDYTDVSITNNVVKNEFDVDAVLEVIDYVEYETETVEVDGEVVTVPTEVIKSQNTISTIPLKVTIENNKFVGFGATTTAERRLDAESSLNGNFVANVGLGGKQLTIVGENITIVDESFKVSEDGSLAGNEVYPMTLNGEAFDTHAQVGEIEIKYNATSINLADFLVNEYNVIEVYADEDYTEELDAADIAVDVATLYLKVFSPDKTVEQTRVINVVIGEAPAPAVEAVSVTLYNDFTMNFKTVGTEVYENVYVDFTLAGKVFDVSDSYVEGDYVVYSFDGIAPHLMGETIKVDIYADVDGTAGVIGTYETTIADYLYNFVTEEVSADNYELYMLAVDALNYGAAAQTFKKYNTENLVNANLTEDEKWVDEEFLENNFNVTELEGAAATWCSKGLYLDNAIDMKLAFKADDVTDMTVVVTDAEGNEVETIDTFVHRDGKYYVYFDNFTVADVDKEFNFTVMKADKAVSGTVTYSVQYYAAQAYEQGIEDLSAIVNTMMAFGRSARLYVDTYLAE